MRRYRDPLVVLLLLALPLTFYVSNARATRDHNLFDRMVVWISAPIQFLVVETLDVTSRTIRRYVALTRVERDNERLRKELADVRAELDRHREQSLENTRLRRLLGVREHAADATLITAHVIGVSPTPLFRSLRIDRGLDDGVRLGSPVASPEGVIGRVAALSSGFADVMLLVDANSSMDVLVQRTRARARVRGKGGNDDLGIDVQYLARTEDVEPGDVLITSGSGGVFPKGLRVGIVEAVERRAFGLYQKATARPSTDFARLEEVLVLAPPWPPDVDFEAAVTEPEP